MSNTYKGCSRSDRGPTRTKRPVWLDAEPTPQVAIEPAPAPEGPRAEPALPTAQTVWQHALNRLVGDVDFPSDTITALRKAEPRWADDEPGDAAPTLPLDDDMLDEWPADPCPTCGSLELWQSITDDWRCLKCEPPSASRRFTRVAQRIRHRYPEAIEINTTTKLVPGAICPCGSTTWRDVPIHDGKAVRRDCELCGRFLDFPVWDGSVFRLH